MRLSTSSKQFPLRLCCVITNYLKKDVAIQCDASQRGLGVALLQGGQPVSRTLTDKEVNYTQIEKELLVIAFAHEKFDAYIYGCDCV